MLKSIVTAAVLLTATAAPALAAEPESFTRNGETFVYTKVSTNDQIILDGLNKTSGGSFHLVIAGGRVTGVSNGQPVSFVMPAGKASTQIAAR